MASIDECCILIPVSTLEDFPKDASDDDARSLLAAWTVLWHPRLVAASQQTPTWYRADGPPELERGSRVITVPTPSLAELPDGFEAKCRENASIQWISGADRNEMLQSLGLLESASSLQTEHRTISAEDFFALGYAMLQTQIMTRRLRYTSNLDEIHFQTKLVSAADAFVADDAEACAAALHDCFDALAQERDHYFSSDPHLVDLTLISKSTLEAFFETLKTNGGDGAADSHPASQSEASNGVLGTPCNVLIDAPMAAAIASASEENRSLLRNRLDNASLGWAGGGLGGDVSLETMTYSDTENAIANAFDETASLIGSRPPVYARYSGTTPSDMTKVIASLGVDGMISIDFENGTGYGDEAKVLRQSGGLEVHALTAKPIDASGDSAFLALGPRLGEAIDSGEIATGLLVHWPGYQSDSYRDVRRVASWSLVLGRFWNLADYFRTGEQPYHHDSSSAAASGAEMALVSQVADGQSDSLSRIVKQTQQSIAKQNEANLKAMIALASGSATNVDSHAASPAGDPAVVHAIGLKASQSRSNVCLINSTPCPLRYTVTMDGNPAKEEHIYATHGCGNQSIVTVDVPAFGFSVARNESSKLANGRSLGRRIREALRTGVKPCADEGVLQNAFFEVVIDPQSGGIKGAYSGTSRGNRFSMRLVAVAGTGKKSSVNESSMTCDQMTTMVAKGERGVIRTSGHLSDPQGAKVGAYEIDYQIERGSRMLHVSGKLDVLTKLVGNPWQHYFAARSAVASEAVSYRVIMRDKMHRTSSRRIVAPLGILMDESERHTLVASAGLAYHRRVEDRFLDTLLQVQGETQHEFSLHYGFDVPSPLLAARSVLSVPTELSVQRVESAASRGWLIHAAPNTILVADVQCVQDSQGRLLGIVRLVQTRSQPCNATVRFCRGVSQAVKLRERVAVDADALHKQLAAHAEAPGLEFTHDLVKIAVAGHEVVDVLIQFDA
ncbi:hypothetical protein Pla52o_40720 [Novipirellula galeiformis]|uniref:Glycoside hydrolase family 38 N-terminal domain-containing protein n=1 Tax=Novipirellula galeiformis TaxID=2528004 RepID=A0A5C6C8X8_9BACT|nr:hypothetical protein [Novipirellula galeiformis]TWU21040.1 hypothetical protein Pla52o_40720 [Novipirellula galeiformis]